MPTTTNFHGATTAKGLSHKDTHWLEFSDDRGNRVVVFMDRSAADAMAHAFTNPTAIAAE